MDKKDLQKLLEQVACGGIKPEEAMLQIKTEPYKDMALPNWTPTEVSDKACPKSSTVPEKQRNRF